MTQMDARLKHKFERIKRKNDRENPNRAKECYMDPKMSDIYAVINHPVNYHPNRVGSKFDMPRRYSENPSRASLERMKETHVFQQKLSNLQKMQLIKNRGICILTKGDKGKQLKIMTQDLKMHET